MPQSIVPRVFFHSELQCGTFAQPAASAMPPSRQQPGRNTSKELLFHWLFNGFSNARSMDDKPIDVSGIGIRQF
jgi:hypothetical protein